jgi:hypothetical protein
MIEDAMARKLLTRAASVAALAAGAARHVAWYLDYRVHGAARAEERLPPDQG